LIATNTISKDFLAKYISYARMHCNPQIPDENVNVLVKCYTDMRSMGNNKKTITATPRQLESLIRIAESIARMRLSDRVEKSDIDEAVRLIKTAMQQSATDPKTGEIDMDIIATGVSATSMKRIKEVCEFIKKITIEYKDNVTKFGLKYFNLFDFLNKKIQEGQLGGESLMEQEFREALMSLEEDGYINLVGHKKAPTIRFCVE